MHGTASTRRAGLPTAAAADAVIGVEAELATMVREGRMRPAQQREHTRALLGAMYQPAALAEAVRAARRSMADCY